MCCRKEANAQATSNGTSDSTSQSRSTRAVPSDAQIGDVLRQVQLGPLLDRVTAKEGQGLDSTADWASILSLGEQQRLAFARYMIQAFHFHLHLHLSSLGKGASCNYVCCCLV